MQSRSSTRPIRVSLKKTQLGLRNSTTRLPFRYGSACLTHCPQSVLKVSIEANGKLGSGYSSDCLPPGWFDKAPDKDFSQQIDDMLAVIALAEKTFSEELAHPMEFFPAWLIAYERVHRRVAEWHLPPLLANFGVSMVERAVIDAMARLFRLSFHMAIRENILSIQPGDVHQQLAGMPITDWLPELPATAVYVRHTIGLADPLTTSEITPEERLTDGFPQSLEQYLERSGIRYLKIKVSNQLDRDLDRLRTVASLVERHRGNDYRVTLDGNEQYKHAEQFDEFMNAIRDTPELQTMFANTLVIEQPLDRKIALDEAHTAGIRRLAQTLPVIIDESDGDLDAYVRAIELGYRGVSSKNCKGPIRSLLNAGLTWLHNDYGKRDDFVMTGEDLCTVGIVSVQSDLCLVATLGLSHVERNGHHYHLGLSYLPRRQQQAALEAHGDLYANQDGIISPRIVDGRFNIASLQCPGFGFAVEPDMESMATPESWSFESLGL